LITQAQNKQYYYSAFDDVVQSSADITSPTEKFCLPKLLFYWNLSSKISGSAGRFPCYNIIL